MNWITNRISKLFPKQYLTNNNSRKTFNEIGVFEYDKSGFTIQYENLTKRIAWADITQLNVYKVDQFTIDRIEMEVVYDEKILNINEELPGWYQFVLKIKEVFPTISKEWDIKIINPAFETNYTTIYEKTIFSQEQK